MILLGVIVITVALQCTNGQQPTSIQLRVQEPLRGNASEADGANTRVDILFEIQISVIPFFSILQDIVVVTASVTSGTATATDCMNPTAGDFCIINDDVTFDFTPTFPNTIAVVLDVFDDLLVEGTESFTVSASITEPGTQPGGVIPRFVPGADTATFNIIDNDFAIFRFNPDAYTVAEDVGTQVVSLELISGTLAFNIGVLVSVAGGTATVGVLPADVSGPAPNVVTFLAGDGPGTSRSTVITVVNDSDMESDETVLISGTSQNTLGQFQPGGDTAFITILDDDGIRGVGDDPHFSIALPHGELLCYTVQGEHGFVFNLISNKLLHMNAMFVPDSHREEVTWLGSMGIIVQNSQYKLSNATYLRFEMKGKKIYIGDKVVLEAKKIEKLIFVKGKLTISETPPFVGFKYPSVVVDLQDVGLNFTIKFMGEHLDLFWHNTGIHTEDSHGLIGQFFRKGVEIDTVRKFLILPGKEPVPVMRRPVWSFMEREVADEQLCWTAMNPGYQGEGLIDGNYFDYLMNDILSTEFKFKKRQ